jgi:YD repeat-containing protein
MVDFKKEASLIEDKYRNGDANGAASLINDFLKTSATDKTEQLREAKQLFQQIQADSKNDASLKSILPEMTIIEFAACKADVRPVDGYYTKEALTQLDETALREGNVAAAALAEFFLQTFDGKQHAANVKLNSDGSVAEIDYPNHTSRTFQYKDGELVEIKQPDGSLFQLVDGKWIEETPAAKSSKSSDGSQSIRSEWDVINPTVWPDGTFTYSDSADRLFAYANDGTGTVTKGSDNSVLHLNNLGQVIEIDYPGGKTRHFGYDSQGNLNAITEPDGQRYYLRGDKWVNSKGEPADFSQPYVSETGEFSFYGKNGLSTTINTDLSSTSTDFSCSEIFKDAQGKIVKIQYFNNTVKVFGYNSDGQLTQSYTQCVFDSMVPGAAPVVFNLPDQYVNEHVSDDGTISGIDSNNHFVVIYTDGKELVSDQSASAIFEQIKLVEGSTPIDSLAMDKILECLDPKQKLVFEEAYLRETGRKLTDDLIAVSDFKAVKQLEAANLADYADRFLTPDKRQAFLDNLNILEQRASGVPGLTDEQMAKVLSSVDTLMSNTNGAVKQIDRIAVAFEILQSSANPGSIASGKNSGISAIETICWNKRPDVAAEMIASIALNGYLISPVDGKHILIPSQDIWHFTGQDSASLKSTTAISSFIFEDALKRLSAPQLNEELKSLKLGDTLVLSNGNHFSQPGDVAVTSEGDLLKEIDQAKESNQLPLIVAVDGGKRFVTIDDYNKDTGMVNVDDGSGKTAWITLEQLWADTEHYTSPFVSKLNGPLEGVSINGSTDGNKSNQRTVTEPNGTVLTLNDKGQIISADYGDNSVRYFVYDDQGKVSASYVMQENAGVPFGKKTYDKLSGEHVESDGTVTATDSSGAMVIIDSDGTFQTSLHSFQQINSDVLSLTKPLSADQLSSITTGMSDTDLYFMQQLYKEKFGADLIADLPKGSAQLERRLATADLIESVHRLLPASERQIFLNNLNAFEERSRTAPGLTDEQVAKTLESMSQLISSESGKVSQSGRITLAEQIMQECATPSRTDQGGHGTCNITTVETICWFRHPEVAANIIASVALNGYWYSPDGTKVVVPAGALIPDKEAAKNPVPDGTRSFASQLFQATIFNELGQKQSSPVFWTQVPNQKGTDAGWGWVDAAGNYTKDGPGWILNSLGAEVFELTGETLAAAGRLVKADGDTVNFSTEAEMIDYLKECKKDGKFPIIMLVWTGAHVVTIDDYDPETGMVSIDNQWGSKSDKWVSLDQLWIDTFVYDGTASDATTA